MNPEKQPSPKSYATSTILIEPSTLSPSRINHLWNNFENEASGVVYQLGYYALS